MLFRQGCQFFGSDRLLVHHFQIDVLMRIGREVVVFLALFEYQQQRPLTCVETLVLQRFLNKLGLAGIQESGEYINRYLLHGLHSKQRGNAGFV